MFCELNSAKINRILTGIMKAYFCYQTGIVNFLGFTSGY
jgi:hypothetical protein